MDLKMADVLRQPPNDSQSHEPPYDSQSHQPPYDSQSHEPPYDSQSHEPPYDSQSHQPPYDSQSHQPPYDSQSHQPPYDSQSHQPPYDTQSKSVPTKKIALSLEQRMEVIKMAESGKSQREIAERFNVGKTQIQNTIKRKAELQADYESSSPMSKKRKTKSTSNEQINDLLVRWFIDATNRRININGPMLQEQALKFAADLNVTNFSASNGWLRCFIKRNNIVLGRRCGEFGYVNAVDVNVTDWMEKITTMMIEGYAHGSNNDSNGGGEEIVARRRVTTMQEGFASLYTLRDFLQQQCLTSALKNLDAVEEDMLNRREEMQQKRITQFFKRKEVKRK